LIAPGGCLAGGAYYSMLKGVILTRKVGKEIIKKIRKSLVTTRRKQN